MLDFIYSSAKRQQLENILFSSHPGHSERLYLTGFLYNCCHLSGKDILRLIQHHSRWTDFDLEECSKHINSICHDLPASFCEDFSFVNHKDDNPQYRKCQDNSIFGKLNKGFFDEPERTSYEYEPGKYNVWGRPVWNAIKYPIYRTIEGRSHLLYYIDIDGSVEDLELSYETAKDIYELDEWQYFKFSGSKGFHLAKKVKNKTRYDLKQMAYEMYKTVKTNLIGFGTANQISKPVLIDSTAYNFHRFVRGFSINFKSNKYSIPVNSDMKVGEILDIASNIDKIKNYLDNNH